MTPPKTQTGRPIGGRSPPKLRAHHIHDHVSQGIVMNPRSWFFRRFTSKKSRGGQSPLRLERLEDRVQPSGTPIPPPDVRSIDGSGNNTQHAAWGSAGVDLLRAAPAAYGDGVSTPAGSNRPGARAISNAVSDQGSQ